MKNFLKSIKNQEETQSQDENLRVEWEDATPEQLLWATKNDPYTIKYMINADSLEPTQEIVDELLNQKAIEPWEAEIMLSSEEDNLKL